MPSSQYPEQLPGPDEEPEFYKAGKEESMSSEAVFVGIDVSKENLDVGVLPTGEHWRTPNQDKPIASLIKRLKPLKPTLIVLEATGGFEVKTVSMLSDADLPVVALNPRQVRDFAKALGVLQKTDKVDAMVLARFAQGINPPLRPVKDAETRAFTSLVNRRAQLLSILTGEKNRLHCPENSKEVRDSLNEHIRWLEKMLKDINDKLNKSIKMHPVWSEKARILESVPGVGPVVIFTLMAHLSELGRLNRKEIAKLCGVAPLNQDSGKHQGYRRVWGGRARVRKALYMAALVATRYNPVIKDMYERLRQGGKDFKVAITACMRKLLTILNSMIKNGKTWDPVR